MIYCYNCRFENRATPCLGRDGRRDFDKLAAAYLDELKAREVAGARPIDSWAWECVSELEHADPHSTLFFILVALDLIGHESLPCMAVLAAGPLETILHNFADEIVGPIELIGQQSAKFRLLLSGIRRSTRIKPQAWDRIRRVLAHGPFMADDVHAPRRAGSAVVGGDTVASGCATAEAGPGASATKPQVLALLKRRVLDDLGGRERAAEITGVA